MSTYDKKSSFLFYCNST